MIRQTILALALGLANAECPNACSGHGSCGAFDECTCFPNWQEADCSGRTCPFGPAHVDTPKGDLDGSADALSGPSSTIVVGSTVYPYGTSEQYPAMSDSEGTTLINTAHAYAECSNKGICDRGSGECECFPGYAGSGCQKAACADPTCSGHGTCMTAEALAAADSDNVYLLWDKEVSMGCKCEPGYSGPACGSKMCKYGIDPLYIDDDMIGVRASTAHVVFTFDNTTATTETWTDKNGNPYTYAENVYMGGTYSIKFYDAFGEDYETEPLGVSADCTEITSALESLANSVIPVGGVACTASASQKYTVEDGLGPQYVAYDLTFQENPGDLKPIEINAFLDGERPTVYLTDGNSTSYDFDVDIAVYPNYEGISGEFIDYFPEYCSGVAFTVAAAADEAAEANGGFSYLTGLTSDEEKALKRCLGDADGNSDNNVEVYNWDYGMFNTTSNPHIVKVAPHPTSGANPKVDTFDAGKYHMLHYGTTAETTTAAFWLSGLPDVSRDYIVFTTDGTATVLGNNTNAAKPVDTAKTGDVQSTPAEGPSTPITAYFAKGGTTVYTSSDVSCDSAGTTLNACLQKGDKVFLFNNMATTDGAIGSALLSKRDGKGSEATGNMYEVVKVGVKPTSAVSVYVEDRYYFVVDKIINYDGAELAPRSAFSKSIFGDGMLDLADPLTQKVGLQMVVKFDVSSATSYEFVSQCSGRGLCNGDSGLCECFAGYTNDNCDLQSALAA